MDVEILSMQYGSTVEEYLVASSRHLMDVETLSIQYGSTVEEYLDGIE